MSDPINREDLERVRADLASRIEGIDRSVEGMRSQNSAEHGSLFGKLTLIAELVGWLKAQWQRFTRPGGDGK